MGCRDSRLKPAEVHVWWVELEGETSALETCACRLSFDEKLRASQLRSEELRANFVLSRGILRSLLGRYLAVSPDRIVFALGIHGKPRVANPETALHFNLAHSGRFAGYAIAAGCEIGIDVEQMRPVADREGIVRRFFSKDERDDWLRLEGPEREESFFRCWTRKEAFIKALGDGLSRPLDSFRVSLGSPPALIHVDGDPSAAGRWSIRSLAPAEGYIGALAVPESQCTVSVFGLFSAAEALNVTAGSQKWPPTPEDALPPTNIE